MNYRLEDLVDIPHFQDLQDRLNRIHSFPSAIIDNDGCILTATAWQEICTRFHRMNKDSEALCIQSDQHILEHIHEADPAVTYRCPLGLIDSAIPIVIDGVHYGNFFTGQFFPEEPDLDFFRHQARRFGYDEAAYLEAVRSVPIWTREQIENYQALIQGMITVIAESGLKRLEALEIRRRILDDEDRHRSILQAAMDGYFLTDGRGNLLDVNAAYCEMTGYSRAELLTMCIADLEANESSEEIKSRLHQLSTRMSERFISRHRRKDSSCFDVEVSVQYREVEDGQCVVFLRDLTDKNCNEMSLQESEERFRILVESAPMSILMLRDGRFIYGNPASARALGYDAPEAIIGKSAFDAIAPEFHDSLVERLQNIEDGKSNPPIEVQYEHENGDRFWSLTSSVSVRMNGRPTAVVVGQDITERKHAEEFLEKYKHIVSSTTDAIAFLDTQYRYIIVNESYEHFSGISREKFIGLTVAEYLGEDVFNQMIKPRFDRCLEGEVINYQEWFDYQHLGRRYMDITYSPYRGAGGRIGGVIANSRDITDRKLAQEEREKLQAQLIKVQRMESIGNLAGGIAHDFNNILFPIVGMSELLLDDLLPGTDAHEHAREILKAGKRGRDLVKQILAFSRQAESEMVPVRIQHVLAEAIKLSRSTIPAYVTITQDIQTDCGMVMADPTQVHQVVMNLITNAYHAMESDGGNIDIRLLEAELEPGGARRSAAEAGRYALLSVSDTGSGISASVLDKIFDPYFTTKEASKGTGLGLSVVHGIVEACKGEIQVQSEVGRGTTFNIYLPLMDQEVPEAPADDREPLPTGNERILLVDDEAAIAGLERKVLERLGYQITSFVSSIEALAAFKETPWAFDLVMSDMSMPHMTGERLAELIAEIRPDLPIIICTGFSERLGLEADRPQGIKHLLMKPASMSDLAIAVRQALG
jgi:PAS domain S-box-containing protein